MKILNLRHAVVLSSIGFSFAISAPLFAQSSTQDRPAKSRATQSGKKRAVESVRSGTVVAPDGQVAITSIDRKWDEKSGTGTINEAAVTPDGRLSSREANLTRNADGTVVAKGTFTDFDGSSFNYTETSKLGASGPAVVGRMLDEEGRIYTYETTVAHVTPGETKRTTVINHPDGSQTTRVEVLKAARPVVGI